MKTQLFGERFLEIYGKKQENTYVKRVVFEMRASLFWNSGDFTCSFTLVAVVQLIFNEENFSVKGAFLYPFPSMNQC